MIIFDAMQDQGLDVSRRFGYIEKYGTWYERGLLCCALLSIAWQYKRMLIRDAIQHVQELDRQVPLMDEIDTKVREFNMSS